MKLILTAAICIVMALAFIALGMGLANCYNKKAWAKYYEGKEDGLAQKGGRP